MAEGFKKYFNSTTIKGRANVAKVTYGAFAVIYLFYRVRRGTRSSPPPGNSVQPDCVCKAPDDDYIMASIPEPEPTPKKDCPICRDRTKKAMKEEHSDSDAERDGYHEPPPTPPRRRCPCENKEPKGNSNTKQQKHRMKHDDDAIHSVEEGCASSEKPIGSSDSINMHEAVYRALRNVIGAVMGSTNTSNATTNSVYESDANIKNDDAAEASTSTSSQPMESDDAGAGIVRGGFSGASSGSSGPSGCGTPNGRGNTTNTQRSRDDDYIDGVGPDIYFDD